MGEQQRALTEGKTQQGSIATVGTSVGKIHDPALLKPQEAATAEVNEPAIAKPEALGGKASDTSAATEGLLVVIPRAVLVSPVA